MLVLLVQIIVCISWLCFDAELSIYLLGKWSLYAQWSALICAAILCLVRTKVETMSSFRAGSLVALVIVSSVILVDLVFVFLFRYENSQYLELSRVMKVIGVSLLVSLLVLRFFALLSVLDRRSKAEAESRILALQSRIQPHFLFNSLNTISELTVVDPSKAEKAIGSLSMLFRAGLENQRNNHSLERELVLSKRYIELEKLRYGDRLTVDWTIEVNDAEQMKVPKLIVQPLLENAIVHGEQHDGTINILVDVRESRNHLSFRLENAKSISESSRTGHGIALDNIRERLLVLYDDQHTFQVKSSDDLFVVLMRIPKHKFTEGLRK